MKVHRPQILDISQVSVAGILRFDSLFSVFQDMALQHTRDIGVEVNDLLDSGRTWVLNRVVVELMRMPRFEEHIDVYTWSRNIVRFKGLREYEIHSQGEKVIAASSLWVHMDIKTGRPARVPADYADRYSVLKDRATKVDVEKIGFEEVADPDFVLPVATRLSDYDINGHVNNAVMLQYIQTALYRCFKEHNEPGELDIRFMHEIPLAVADVSVVLQRTGDGCLFEVRGDDMVCVRGKLIWL